MPRLTPFAYSSVLLVLGGAVAVRAHGWQASLCIGQGACQQAYKADAPNDPGNSNATWPFNTNSPIPNDKWSGNTIACNSFDGQPAKPAKEYWSASAGDEITVHMTPWDSSYGAAFHWGPILVYIADCKGDCTTLDVNAPNVWTKIYEAGWLADRKKWAAQVIGENNNTFVFRLPEDLPTGKYLVRPEVVSLQFAFNPGTAQLFIACHNFDVVGTAKTSCAPTGGVSFPGTYNSSDSHFAYNIWLPDKQNVEIRTNATDYVPPGGPIWPGCSGAGGGTDQPAPYNSGKPAGGLSVPGSRGNTAIVAGVAGGVGGFILVLLLVFCCCFRRRSIEQAECDAKDKQNAALAAAVLAEGKDGSLCDRESLAYSHASKAKTPTSAYYPASAFAGGMYGPDGLPAYSAPSAYGHSIAAYPYHHYPYAASHYAGSAHSYTPDTHRSPSRSASSGAATFAPPLSRSVSAPSASRGAHSYSQGPARTEYGTGSARSWADGTLGASRAAPSSQYSRSRADVSIYDDELAYARRR